MPPPANVKDAALHEERSECSHLMMLLGSDCAWSLEVEGTAIMAAGFHVLPSSRAAGKDGS